jgi:hypothetical protein
MPRIPLCANLNSLGLVYKRWLRGPERKALIPVFGDIIISREKAFGLFLGLDWPVLYWTIRRPVESTRGFTDRDEISVIGISGPCGIIPIQINVPTEIPFKEAEYLLARHQLSISCLLTLRNLVELRVGDEQDILPTAPPPNLPLFHTLRVLEANNIHHSFLAGKTFHKLEMCRISLRGEGLELSHGQVTQMPVCTRLDVDDLTLLATFKLPQICELGVSFDHPEFNMIWGKHIAVNVNLSGLELLHVDGWHQQADLIQALRCLPALKSLIIGNGPGLDAKFFGEFLPMHLSETTGLIQSHDEGQIFLYPMLTSLLIEGCDLVQRPELEHVFEQVVTLRAVHRSPLERFTLFDFDFERKTELIGSHGSFVVETVALDEDAEPFRLDI